MFDGIMNIRGCGEEDDLVVCFRRQTQTLVPHGHIVERWRKLSQVYWLTDAIGGDSKEIVLRKGPLHGCRMLEKTSKEEKRSKQIEILNFTAMNKQWVQRTVVNNRQREDHNPIHFRHRRLGWQAKGAAFIVPWNKVGWNKFHVKGGIKFEPRERRRKKDSTFGLFRWRNVQAFRSRTFNDV